MDEVVCKILRLDDRPIDLSEWEGLVERVHAADRPVRVGVVGKYTSLPDAYLSVIESLNHAGFFHGAKVDIDLIPAEDVEGLLGAGRLKDLDGIVIPGGFGERGIEGKIAAAGYAREEGIPCLGLCLGLHMMVIEYARDVLGLDGRQLQRVRLVDAASGHRPDGRPAGGHRQGRHHAPGRLRRRAGPRLAGGPGLRHATSCPSATATATSSTPATGPGSRRAACSARASRPTAGWWSSSSCRATRSGSPPRPTPSSRAAPSARRRCSGSSSAPRWTAPRAAAPTCSSSRRPSRSVSPRG